MQKVFVFLNETILGLIFITIAFFSGLTVYGMSPIAVSTETDTSVLGISNIPLEFEEASENISFERFNKKVVYTEELSTPIIEGEYKRDFFKLSNRNSESRRYSVSLVADDEVKDNINIGLQDLEGNFYNLSRNSRKFIADTNTIDKAFSLAYNVKQTVNFPVSFQIVIEEM